MLSSDGWRGLLATLAIDRSDWRTEFGRVLRYGVVGLLTAIVYWAATIAGVELLHFRPVGASVLAQLISIGVAYYGHAIFSYRVAPGRDYFVRFLIITSLLFALNIAVTWTLTERFGISYKLAIVVLAVVIPLANFLLTRFWVFLPGLLPQTPSRLSRRSQLGKNDNL